MDQPTTSDALAGIRVLDLAGPFATFTAKLLASYGADVIRIEPPGGDPQRKLAPVAGKGSGPGIPFLANHTNKRSAVLDLMTLAGQRVFRRLATTADVVLETEPPGSMARRGIGPEQLLELNARLVYAAVTPFGQTGPYARYRATDFTAQAMGGAVFLTGEAGEKPVRGGGRVAEKMAGYTTATAVAMALIYRNATGTGQFIDVSVQEAVASQMESSAVSYWFTGMVRQRNGWRYPSTTCPAGVYPCKDGYASIVASKEHQWVAFRDWVGDERLYKEEYLLEPNRFADRDYIDPIVIEWTRTMPKAELFHDGQRRGIPIGESMTPLDLVKDLHLRARGYYVETEHPEVGTFEFPGAPFPLSETPFRVRRPAPALGQHTAEVLAEAGLTPAEIEDLTRQGVVA